MSGKRHKFADSYPELRSLIECVPCLDERDRAIKARFLSFLSENENALERSCAPGHITSSAFLFSDDYRHIVLLHHRKLGKWLQPGGHVDGDPDVLGSARRELREETGIESCTLVCESPIDLDVHVIPASHEAPGHYHYDVRYAFSTTETALAGNRESNAVRWCSVSELQEYTSEPSIVRVVAKVIRLATTRAYRE